MEAGRKSIGSKRRELRPGQGRSHGNAGKWACLEIVRRKGIADLVRSQMWVRDVEQ